MKKILVSQCLYGGKPVRYDGKAKEEKDVRFLKWKEEGRLIPVCPEVFGGLPIPRTDAQRKKNKVVTRDGVDVTAEYERGAAEALRLAKENEVLCALLKEKSPSCGSSYIYDGNFRGKLIEGEGIAAELLRRSGIKVFSENQIDEVENLIEEVEHGKEKPLNDDAGRKKNIVLIGMPSCGKSVTGVILAKSMGMSFVDTDLLIQNKSGKSLQEIINQDGMEKFKQTEEEILKGLDTENTVIATGGSAVYYPEAMEHLKAEGVIVYIEVSVRTIKKRLRNITTRGVAMEKGQSIEDLYRERLPLYERYADLRVKSDEHHAERTVEKIMKAVGENIYFRELLIKSQW